MSFDVPVLLLTWRRPDTTCQVLDALRRVAPLKLYVASDGSRNEAEAKAVQATRNLIAEFVDWPCELKTLFRSKNQGCQLGVSSAITWFFEQEEEGIVLEDDCVPHPDFFPYCRELLNRYRNDTRIWCISGDNFQAGAWRGESSYYFSRYNHCWGWATWKRCWDYYSDHEQIWEHVKSSDSLQRTMFENPHERFYWMKIWTDLFMCGFPDSWAYRWTLVCMANGGLTALPNLNLVLNIGINNDALHTFSEVAQSNPQAFQVTSHPKFVCRDSEADDYTYNFHFGGSNCDANIPAIFRRFASKSKRVLKVFKSKD